MSDVFISYAREDKAFVARLHEALERRGRNSWVDWDGIPPTAEWLSEILGAIDASEAFVFIVSPDSVASTVCGKELLHAIEQNKRLIPLVIRDANSSRIPPSLGELNWIFSRNQDEFESSVDTLIEALDTDLERVKAHTRLLVRAREWDNRKHHSLLLRSRDLEQAERQFVGGVDLEPKPTALQLRFVTASRRRAAQVQRRILASVTLAMFSAIALAAIAWVQRQFSERRAAAAIVRDIATAKPLDALAHAVGEMGQWFSDDVPEVRSSLLAALQTPKERAIHEREGNWPVSSVALMKNGTVAAALDPRYAPASVGTSLAIWDREGNREADLLAGAPITLLAGCPAESIVLAVSEDGFLQIQDLEDRTETQIVRLDDPSPAESTIETNQRANNPSASLGSYGDAQPATQQDVRVEGIRESKKLPVVCSSSPGPRMVAAFSSDCRRIAIGSESATQIWSRDGELELLGTLLETRAPRAIAVDRSGQVVARGYDDGSIFTASPSENRKFKDEEYARHTNGCPINALAMSPDGRRIASADGNTVRLWQGEAGAAEPVGDGFHGHEDLVTALAFDTADGAFVVSGSWDNTIRVWDLTGKSLSEPYRGHDGWIRSVAVADNSMSIVSAGNDGTVRRWDAIRNPVTLPCNEPLLVLALSDDHKTRLVQAWADTTQTWDLYTMDVSCKKQPVAGGAGSPLGTLSRNGRFVAFVDAATETIVLRDRTSAVKDKSFVYPQGLRTLAVSQDGLALALAGDEKVVRLWSYGNKEPRIFSKGHELPIISLAFGSDGQILASGSEDNTVLLWDVQSGESIGRPLQGHEGWISAVAISRDGRFVVSGSWDRTVRLWDIEGNPMGKPFRGHTAWITHVGFHPEEPRIISHGSDNTKGLWQGGDVVDWMRASCRQLDGHAAKTDETYARASSVCSRTLP